MRIMTGAELITEERQRQIQEKGFTAEHDMAHTSGDLARAAISYTAYALGDVHHSSGVPHSWPWSMGDWRPEGSQLSNLVKAGAFLAAEIDRLQADLIRKAQGAE